MCLKGERSAEPGLIMEWTIGSIMAIGLRVIEHRSEVERVGRKLIAHIVATEEIFNETKALLKKIVPELAVELSKAEASPPAAPSAPPSPPAAPLTLPVQQLARQFFPMGQQHRDPRGRRGR